jgi:hypothetical protein
MTSQLFDPRWTYTVTGKLPGKAVEVRQVRHDRTIFLDVHSDAVLDIIAVKEPAPRGWKERTRMSAVMIGMGVQGHQSFTVTQWATNWEQALFDAARPMMALVHRVFTLDMKPIRVLAGDIYSEPATWPTIDLRDKSVTLGQILRSQGIEPNTREQDIEPRHVSARWRYSPAAREEIWRHNYLNVMDLAMRAFQIEWPTEETDA